MFYSAEITCSKQLDWFTVAAADDGYGAVEVDVADGRDVAALTVGVDVTLALQLASRCLTEAPDGDGVHSNPDDEDDAYGWVVGRFRCFLWDRCYPERFRYPDHKSMNFASSKADRSDSKAEHGQGSSMLSVVAAKGTRCLSLR